MYMIVILVYILLLITFYDVLLMSNNEQAQIKHPISHVTAHSREYLST